jgi:predicted RNase H-like HicB family nuclease
MESKFSYIVFWSDDDEQYVGVCKELPSLSAFGDTYIEAMENIIELVGTSLEILADQTKCDVEEV